MGFREVWSINSNAYSDAYQKDNIIFLQYQTWLLKCVMQLWRYLSEKETDILLYLRHVAWKSPLLSTGSFKFVLKVDANVALVMAIVPPAVYIILCYHLGHAKSDLQINIAGIMSIFYAFLMTATILSIVGEWSFLLNQIFSFIPICHNALFWLNTRNMTLTMFMRTIFYHIHCYILHLWGLILLCSATAHGFISLLC